MVEVRVPKEIDAESAERFRNDVHKALAIGGSPLVLRGSVDCFCLGVALKAVARNIDPRPSVQAVADALEDLLHSPVPTIAVVEGAAIGGGVGMLAACDRVLATAHATFAMPELIYGLVPLVILPALQRRIDPTRWTWLALSAHARTATEALELGLVDEIVPSEDLPRRVAATAKLLARVDRTALASVRAHRMPRKALHEELERAVGATVERLMDPDVRSRMATYLSEGIPPWSSRLVEPEHFGAAPQDDKEQGEGKK